MPLVYIAGFGLYLLCIVWAFGNEGKGLSR